MKKTYKYAKNILKDNMFWLFILISILFFGIFIKLEYATDTYSIFNQNYIVPFNHFMTSGRFITAFFWFIISILNFGLYKSYILSFLLAIVAISLSIYKLYNIIYKLINNKLMSSIIGILVILNAFSIELFLFFEKGIMVFSVFMSIIAIEYLVKYFEDKKAINILFILICMLFAMFSYQGTVAIFVSIASIYIIKYSKNFKDFIKNNILIAFMYGIPAIINLLVVDIFFSNSRISGSEHDLIESLKRIISGMKNMIVDTYGILPQYSFVSLLLIVLLIVFLKIIFSKGNIASKSLHFLKISYVILLTLFVTIAPQLLVNSDSIWLVARSTYAFASIIGIILMYLLYNYNLSKILTNTLIIVGLSYLFIQYVGFQNVSRDHYILNYMDSYISSQIQEQINEYENDTGKIIKNVVVYKDKYQSYSYPNLMCYGDINVSAFIPEWSILGLLNIKLNRELILSDDKNGNYENHFSENNWNYYSKEQIIFDNNTMHLCVF